MSNNYASALDSSYFLWFFILCLFIYFIFHGFLPRVKAGLNCVICENRRNDSGRMLLWLLCQHVIPSNYCEAAQGVYQNSKAEKFLDQYGINKTIGTQINQVISSCMALLKWTRPVHFGLYSLSVCLISDYSAVHHTPKLLKSPYVWS